MSFTRLFDIPQHQLQHYPQNKALVYREAGAWRAYSTQEFCEQINRVSNGLRQLGIGRGETVAIISGNRPQWNFVDLGVQQIGAIPVPVYPDVNERTIRHILEQAEIKLAFVEGADAAQKVRAVWRDVPGLKAVYSFKPVDDLPLWEEMLGSTNAVEIPGRSPGETPIEPDDVATILFTSGTSGRPKGVRLSHRNLISNVHACEEVLFPLNAEHRALSLLPLSHAFERLGVYFYMAAGLSVYYAENVSTIARDLQEVRPHIFTTVPRLLEKVYERLLARREELSRPQRVIFDWALDLAERYEYSGNGPWYTLQQRLADRLVYRQIRNNLGGEIIALISGGAALKPKLARIFTAAGVDVLEGYGLTETSPILAANGYRKRDRRFGAAGKAVKGVELKIGEDEEILGRGPNVMQGYLHDEAATRQVLETDGWFHTGDLGHLDADGFLFITGRRSSQFKTSGGKYVAPGPIEDRLDDAPLISSAVLVGEGRKMVTAIIQPDWENLREWCAKQGISWESREVAIAQEAVRERYSEVVQSVNRELDNAEQIKRFRLVADEWSVASGELTPTLKLKRRVVQEQYATLIEEMYRS